MKVDNMENLIKIKKDIHRLFVTVDIFSYQSSYKIS